MITCYVLDDEFHAIEILAEYIERTEGVKLIGTATDPLKALNEIGITCFPDIIFADVDMPRLSGLEFAGFVSVYGLVIFTTAHSRFAVQAFEKEAFDFLVKPIVYERFLKCIQRVRKHLAERRAENVPARGDYFFAKSEVKGKILRIEYKDIVYVSSEKNYVVIHLDNEKFTIYLTMNEIEEFLPSEHFTRVHKSYLVNYRKIKIIEGNRIILSNGVKVDIGITYRDDFVEKMERKLIVTKRKL